MNLCQCGCGQLCNLLFVRGHNRKDTHLTKEWKAKISVSVKRKHYVKGEHYLSKEGRAKLSAANTGEKNPGYGKHYHFTKEQKAQISASLIKYFDIHESPLKGKSPSQKNRHACSLRLKRLHGEPELLGKILKGRVKRPTKPEQQLIDWIDKYKLPYKYVGDGQFILGGKCPDFLNINGKKQLIELFGTYWHDIFDVAKRTEHFRQYGFSTLIIWEDELNNPGKVVKKVKAFAGRK